MSYTCPICGYNKLRFPPVDFTICPCCGTEFGNDDLEFTHEEIRQQWIASGMHWFSDAIPRPANWNPIGQLLAVTLSEITNNPQTTEDTQRIAFHGNIVKPRNTLTAVASNSYVFAAIFSATSTKQVPAAL